MNSSYSLHYASVPTANTASTHLNVGAGAAPGNTITSVDVVTVRRRLRQLLERLGSEAVPETSVIRHSTLDVSGAFAIWIIGQAGVALVPTSDGRNTSLQQTSDVGGLYGDIERTRELVDGWNEYGSAAPNERSRVLASRVMDVLFSANLMPTRVIPSGEGGIGLTFRGEGRSYADIECFNTGEMLAGLVRPGFDPEVWTIGTDAPLGDTVERIRTFLRNR